MVRQVFRFRNVDLGAAGQEVLEKWDARAGRLHSRMEITGEGLTLGAGTVLAGMAQDERGAPKLALDDEARDGPACHSLRAAGR
jgi:hypothetical protein